VASKAEKPTTFRSGSAALAGEGYSTVVGIGAQARAAVAQAEAGEVGADTRWDSGR
jgi:hypothetical protein